MALQIRLVHALGDRLIDLPDQSIDSPVVVGRATDAQVQVPSVNVSRRHCILFVHEGQWVVEDGGSTGGTFVNGQPIAGATFVGTGDVITLGADPQPPTLVIDPFGLQKVIPAAHQVIAAAPIAAPELPPQPAYAAAYKVPHDPASSWEQPGPAYAPSFTVDSSGVPEIVDDRESDDAPVMDMVLNSRAVAVAPPLGDPSEDWMTPAAGADPEERRRYYVPRQSAWTPGVIAAMVVGGIAILGIGAYVYNTREKASEEARKAAQAPPPAAISSGANKKNIFDDMEAETKRKAAAFKAQAARDAGKKVVSTEEAAAQDPGRSSEDWLRVEAAHSAADGDPIHAILVYDDYNKLMPQSPYAADIRKYTDEAVDLLWWKHITDLVNERDDLRKQIGEKNRDLSQTKDAEMTKTLKLEKAPLEAKLAEVMAELKERHYLSETKPNVFDLDQMAANRTSRNAEMFEQWRKGAEKVIKESRGTKLIWK
jgi:hypothetical protein